MSKRMTFWAGFSLAGGGILAVAVVAFAGSSGKTATAASDRSVRSGPPAQALAALQRPQTGADSLPPAEARTAASLLEGQDAIAESARPGTLLMDQSRLLLRAVGTSNEGFYAFPTSKGAVCYVISAGPASCALEVTREAPAVGQYDPDRIGAGTPMAFYGLLPNDATKVEILVRGEARRAIVAQNAFFYRLSRSDPASADAIIIGFRDGTSDRLTLPEPPGRTSP